MERKKKQECIPVECVPPACFPYLPACTAQGGGCTCQGVYLVLGGYLVPGGVPGPRGYQVLGGCTWSWVVQLVLGCTWFWGYVPGPRGCTWSRGGLVLGGTWSPGGVPAQVLPPVNRMTDRCKNITLPQTSFAGDNN